MAYVETEGRASAEERYMSALRTSQLGHFADKPCDADKLLAAAYAVRGDRRRMLALEVYSVLATTNLRGARGLADKLGAWMVSRCVRERAQRVPPRIEAADMALQLLKLWHRRACPECHGRGHPLRQGSPVLDETRDCPECHGTGVIPLERLFRHEQVPLARWLEREVHDLCSTVFSDMAGMLANRMDLNMK
jgi:hypothetical protein